MPAKKEISLLPEQENSNSLINKTLRWLTTVGRVVIVITELIVVTAFISRFWLDRKNSDLSDTIRQQKAILETTQDFEKEYDLLVQRLNAIKNSNQNDANLHSQLNDLTTSLPQGIYLENLSVDTNQKQPLIKMSAIAYEESTIVDFITNLSLNPSIEKVDIQKIEKKSKDNKYIVSLSTLMKSGGQK